ncbi:MAG TPA: hypothetical protein VFI65_32945 [Streptosporangiaceae bacterium]|nr:hypothetical protein [Streptosporangiaceae bacterium]
MRFLRHLGAATLLVAVVVGLGLAWNHFAPGTLVGDLPGPSRQPILHGAALRSGKVVILRPTKGHAARIISLQPGAHPPRSLTKHGIVVVVRGGPMDLGLGSMFQPVNLGSLKHTAELETLLIAAVVIIDVTRRRQRRARRKREAGSGVPSALWRMRN